MLGYDVHPQGGRLIVNEAEARCVREIFTMCARAGTVMAGLREIQERGFSTKVWTSRGGRHHAGHAFSPNMLRLLLENVLYSGSIRHKGVIYPGEQPAIVEGELWERVQQQLNTHSGGPRARPKEKQQALLAGLLYCGQCGSAMTPTYTGKQGERHSYYVCKAANPDFSRAL